MTKRRQISLLPQVHQTDALKRFFNSTVDQLFDEGKTVPLSGYIGRKPDHFDPLKDFYKPEPSAARERYQLEPMMISADENRVVQSQLFYEDLISRLNQEGANTSNPNRLFGAGYYSWAPPIDIDRIMNFQQYYWSGSNTTSLVLTVPGIEVGARHYGNGATVDFKLPPVLANRAGEEIVVLVDGVVADPSTYSASSTTVTFNDAPSEDILIVLFRYGNIGDGVRNTFLIPEHCTASEGTTTVFAYVNGRPLDANEYTVNDETVTLATPAPANSHVWITRIDDLKKRIEGNAQFDPTGLTRYPVTELIDGMKVQLVDPVNFLTGFDLKAYGHPWDEVGHSTFFVEGVDISIVLVPIENSAFSGDGFDADDPRYVVIARSDRTRSFWSRVNRWVHRDALIDAEDAKVENRAKRPIIEFLANIQQFQYGTYRVQNTSGSISASPIYNGEPIHFKDINGLPEGGVIIDGGFSPRKGDVIFVNLPDSPHNSTIFHVDTVATDNDPNTQVYVLEPLIELEAGAVTAIKMKEYWFDGLNWNEVGIPGEAPLFDLYDHDGISLADPGVFPDSNFEGSRLFSFATGSGKIDPVLKKKLRHDKYGQIVFENELETRSFSYRDGAISGYRYYHRDGEFLNAWHKADDELVQAIDENNVSEIPLNLQANPDFDTPTFLSRNDFFEHFSSILKNQDGFEGQPYAANNWYKTKKDVTKGLVVIQHEAPLLKLMALLENEEISVSNAIRFIEREYTRFKAKFLKTVVEISREMDAEAMQDDDLAVMALRRVSAGKTVSFPFNDTRVGGDNFFIPITPSLLGITPLVRPGYVSDDTFGGDVTFIRGHDGSLTAAFGDVRDAALTALELRIYLNAQEREDKMHIHDLVSGRNREALYSHAEYVEVMMPMFERWARDNGVNYENAGFDEDNPFSWNYRSCTDRFGGSCRGHWRGIYFDLFDTDRPNAAPWEMLGFAEMPDWWETEYGPGPYTRANTILWNDVAAGIIRQGERAGTDERYVRPDLMQILPVDLNGEMLDPVAATIVPTAPPIQFARSGWQFGDGSDIEAIWRYSSNYAFHLAHAKFLMRPAYFVERFWDVLNETTVHGQTVQTPEMRRIHHREITVHGELVNDTTKDALGVQNWIIDHLRHAGKTPALLGNIVRGLRTRLGHKVAGFTTPDRMTISAESFGLVPDEDITISIYSSPSMTEFFYSGVLIENTPTGWRIVGYNPDYPFFDVILGEEGSRKTKITSGAPDTTRAIHPWHPSVYYKKDMLVDFENQVYRCVSAHTSAAQFEETFWSLSPTSGKQLSTTVVKHTKNTGIVDRIEYGTELRTKQDVADVLFGYERYLASQGFVFDAPEDEGASWVGAVRNFLKWSEVEWADGAFITLSPAARVLKFTAPTGIVTQIENSVIDRTGHFFDPENYSVDRAETETVITAHSDDIYGARLSKTEIEHCLIFSNETIFGDIIFNPLFNIRQYRLKMSARVAPTWEGRYEAPGFVIQGDQIVPNFVKLGEDIREMFDIELADNTVLRDHARHVIGFETRPYLDQLLMNETQQFEMYQGMIQQKGSKGALSAVLRSNEIEQSRDLAFLEEWAFRVGTFGAYHPTFQMEFSVRQSDISNEKQVINLTNQGKDDWFNMTSDRWVSIPSNFDELQTPQTSETMPDAGYVRAGETKYVYAAINDFSAEVFDGLECKESERIWLTHGDAWEVLRLTYPTDDLSELKVLRIMDEAEGVLEDVEDFRIVFDKAHNLEVGDSVFLCGGTYDLFRGEHIAIRTGEDWIEVSSEFQYSFNFEEDGETVGAEAPVPLLTRPLRVANIAGRDALPGYENGVLAFVDDAGEGKWAVYKKVLGVWIEQRRQPKKIENKKIASATVYETSSALTETELQVEPAVAERMVVVDPLAGLIPGVVDRELDFKLEYDPADYTEWANQEVGKLWWDIDTVRFMNYYTDAVEEFDADSARYLDEITYRSENWAKVSPTSTVDIYEWTRSFELPGDVANYVERVEYNSVLNREAPVYYFWSLNTPTVPRNSHRRLSAKSCAEIIQNPARAGLVWFAAVSGNCLLVSGIEGLLDDDGRVMQINYSITDYEGDEHAEWVLLRQGDRTTMPPMPLWTKLLDSLRGVDLDLKTLPSQALHPTQRSGLLAGQSMFGDLPNDDARKSFIQMLNYILLRKNHSRIGLLEEKLSLADNPPEYLYWSPHTGDLPLLPPKTEYDHVVLHADDLADALTKHYRVLLDNRGADFPSWSVWERGANGAAPTIVKAYDRVVDNRFELNSVFLDMQFKERVLVLNDEEADGFWTIWEKRGDGAWDVEPFDEFLYDGFTEAKLGLVNCQKYRTRDFWTFVDWYDASVDQAFPPHIEYATPEQRNVSEGLNPTNDFVRIRDDNGYWSWTRFSNGEWVTVARENATFQLDEKFFTSDVVFGIRDEEMFLDVSQIADRDGTIDLTPLVEAVRTNVLTLEEVNELWFSMIHFIHTKIDKVDWAIKTSFMSVLGFNERLWASPVAMADNMPLLLDYIEEVKPYRVKVRDILRTASPDIDVADTIVTDFDKPVYFDPVLEIYRRLNPAVDGNILSDGLYRHFTEQAEKRRRTNIGMLFDRVWPTEGEVQVSAADRIMAYYQPGSNMRAKNLTELLDLDFKGTVYDGSTIGDTDNDVILRGSNAAGSQIDLNVEGGFKLRDPHAAAQRPEELVTIGMHDGLVFRAHDRWGNGAPQHNVRYYDVSRRKTSEITLELDALVDSVAVFLDGIRTTNFELDQLGHSVSVTIVPGTTKSVAIHGFGLAAVDAIRDQRYYKGGAATYQLDEAYSAKLEASVNGTIVDDADVSVELHTVTLPATTASDAVMLTLYSSDDPRPIRQQSETLSGSGPWLLSNLPTMRPYAAGVIVEKNGLRLTPPRYYYSMNESSYYVDHLDAADVFVYDNRYDTPFPVVDLSTLSGDEFEEEIDIRARNFEERFVLWNGRVVFLDEDAAARNYVVVVKEGHEFDISYTGELSLITPLGQNDSLKVMSFSNDAKMDMRTHTFKGNESGIYPLRTTRNGRAWLTLNGRRLVENIDFHIDEREAGSWDIDPFETFNYDSFRFVQIALRFPGEEPITDIVITTFEGQENNPASSWQMSTTTPEEMRLLPANEDGSVMYVVRKAWEIASLDTVRRAGKLTVDIESESPEIVVEINPSDAPNVMIPSQPLLVPDGDQPGVVWIGGERVEYFAYNRSGKTITLSQLRRGTRGTAKTVHLAGELAMAGHELDRMPPTPFGPYTGHDCGPPPPPTSPSPRTGPLTGVITPTFEGTGTVSAAPITGTIQASVITSFAGEGTANEPIPAISGTLNSSVAPTFAGEGTVSLPSVSGTISATIAPTFSGAGNYIDPPTFHSITEVGKSTAQSPTTGTLVTWDNELQDAGEWFGINNTDIVVVDAALYRVGQAIYANPVSSTAPSIFEGRANNVMPVGMGRSGLSNTSGNNSAITCSAPLALAAGTAINTRVLSGNANINTVDRSTFWVERLPSDLNYCLVDKTANQTFVATNTWQDITFTRLSAGNSVWQNGDNVNFRVPAGVNKVRVVASMAQGSSGAGFDYPYLQTVKNDVRVPGMGILGTVRGNGAVGALHFVSAPLPVVEGDLIKAQAQSNTTSTNANIVANAATFLSIEAVPDSHKTAIAYGLGTQPSTAVNTWGALRFATESHDEADIWSPAAQTDFVVPAGCERAKPVAWLDTSTDKAIRCAQYRGGSLVRVVVHGRTSFGGGCRDVLSGPWVPALPGDVFRFELYDTVGSWGSSLIDDLWGSLECSPNPVS
jgi:hypothetical protein